MTIRDDESIDVPGDATALDDTDPTVRQLRADLARIDLEVDRLASERKRKAAALRALTGEARTRKPRITLHPVPMDPGDGALTDDAIQTKGGGATPVRRK